LASVSSSAARRPFSRWLNGRFHNSFKPGLHQSDEATAFAPVLSDADVSDRQQRFEESVNEIGRDPIVTTVAVYP
jgi:hypothetical protein